MFPAWKVNCRCWLCERVHNTILCLIGVLLFIILEGYISLIFSRWAPHILSLVYKVRWTDNVVTLVISLSLRWFRCMFYSLETLFDLKLEWFHWFVGLFRSFLVIGFYKLLSQFSKIVDHHLLCLDTLVAFLYQLLLLQFVYVSTPRAIILLFLKPITCFIDVRCAKKEFLSLLLGVSLYSSQRTLDSSISLSFIRHTYIVIKLIQ